MGSKKKQQSSSNASAAFGRYLDSFPFAIDHSADPPTPSTSSLTSTSASITLSQSVESSHNVLLNDMSVEDLLKRIGTERNPPWTQEEMAADAEILNQNRIRNVGELRILSKHSWKEIKLLPVVKDLIIGALKMAHKDEKKKVAKRKDHVKNDLSGTADALSNLELESHRENSDDSSDSDELEGRGTLAGGRPPSREVLVVPRAGSIKTVSISRMKVAVDNGKIYEVNRICPHKHADMSLGRVRGTVLYCPKHDWGFDLAAGGVCREKGKGGKTLDACLVNDW